MRFFNQKSYLLFALTLLPVPAMAGFEFRPVPQQQIMPRESVSVMPAPVESPKYSDMNVAPMPVAPVISAPLPVPVAPDVNQASGLAPIPNMPVAGLPMQAVPPPPSPQAMPANSMAPMAPVMPPVMQSSAPQAIVPVVPAMPAPVMMKKSGLFIDPYPLQDSDNKVVAPKKIARAVAEKAGGLNPVQ